MIPVLSTESVTVRFGALLALDDVSINVGDRQIVSLIGPNGAGKTTLLNAISGLLVTERGRVMIAGRDVSSEPAEQRASTGVRRTFQHARLSDDLTVLENVLVGVAGWLLLVFEDAHWADPTSLDLLATVVERAAELPILAVVSHRPEFSPRWGDLAHVVPISLHRAELGARPLAPIDRPTPTSLGVATATPPHCRAR